MDTRLLVDVAYGADQLGEGFLDLVDREFAVFDKVVVQLVAWRELGRELRSRP